LTVAAFFLDTSTVLKRYVQETGTAWVQALAAPAVGHSLFVVRIMLDETVAAITRRERGGSISPQDAATALADFQLDFARQYRVVEVSAGLDAQAATLARRHGLRGYDAVQLAAVLEIHATDPSLTLIRRGYSVPGSSAWTARTLLLPGRPGRPSTWEPGRHPAAIAPGTLGRGGQGADPLRRHPDAVGTVWESDCRDPVSSRAGSKGLRAQPHDHSKSEGRAAGRGLDVVTAGSSAVLGVEEPRSSARNAM